MRSRLRSGVVMVLLLLLGVCVGIALAGEFQADVQFDGSMMVLNVPVKGILKSRLVVSGPEGYRLEIDLGGGAVVSVDLAVAPNGQAIGLLDGAYKWELRVYTGSSSEAAVAGPVPGSPTMAGAVGSASERWVMTGRFRVEGGSIVVVSDRKAGDPRTGGASQGVTGQGGSQVAPLDVIGEHLYVVKGICSGCYNLDSDLASGELLVKDGAPWITMRDTDNDQRWRWYSSIGQLYLTSSPLNGASETFPLSIERNTPDNTLYLDNRGIVGIGTSTPSTYLNISGLDIVRPSHAGIRMKSTNSGAHSWAWHAGPAGCYLTDETRVASPFFVLNGAPEGTLQIQGNGNVSIKGTLILSSSREYKENIKELSTEEALKAFQGLNPVAFTYKAGKGEQHVGFIAEDVPELVATKDRKGLSPMDIVAVLTKVVQEQQKMIEEQKIEYQKTISTLREELNELKGKVK